MCRGAGLQAGGQVGVDEHLAAPTNVSSGARTGAEPANDAARALAAECGR